MFLACSASPLRKKPSAAPASDPLRTPPPLAADGLRMITMDPIRLPLRLRMKLARCAGGAGGVLVASSAAAASGGEDAATTDVSFHFGGGAAGDFGVAAASPVPPDFEDIPGISDASRRSPAGTQKISIAAQSIYRPSGPS